MADPSSDLRPIYVVLLQQLHVYDSLRQATDDSFEDFEHAVFDGPNDTISNANSLTGSALANARSKLTIHAHDAILNETEYFDKLMTTLVVLTRTEPLWRSHFGSYDSALHKSHAASMQDPEPDCVLELARRVCTLNYRVSSTAIEQAFIIIANCCADNNENRSLIIHRDGLETMLRLLRPDGLEPDYIISALFNVCTDYNEPAQYLGLGTSSVLHDAADCGTILTLATERLASANRFNPQYTTFELLLLFWNRLSWHVLYTLVALIEMATEPALGGLEHIRADADSEDHPWTWSFDLFGEKHDTIAVAASFSAESAEFAACVNKAMVNILSQQSAREALFRRDDDSLWTLLTAVYGHQELDDEMLELDDESPYEELSVGRRAFLKILYEITGDPRFCRPGVRASALLGKSVAELDRLTLFLWNKQTQQGLLRVVQQTNQAVAPHLDSRDAFLISACVIISQLCASDELRDELSANRTLVSAVVRVFTCVQQPDILYPALTIVTRLSLTPDAELPLVNAGILQKMQHLLTTKGKGLIVPFETVTAYKTILRGRPQIISLLLTRGDSNRKIVEDVFNLWSITVEAGTKLEIGKFFLEILRTVLLAVPKEGAQTSSEVDSLLTVFNEFLQESALQIAEAFTWVCTKAQSPTQRQHGWFGLAMLSQWQEARPGILQALEQHEALRSAVLQASELPDGAVVNNLKFMLSKLQLDLDRSAISDTTIGVLRSAASNSDLKGLFDGPSD